MPRVFTTQGTVLFFSPFIQVRDNCISDRETFRSDIWKPSEIRRIAKTLNNRQLSEKQTLEELAAEIRDAINSELRRQCDEWNSKL